MNMLILALNGLEVYVKEDIEGNKMVPNSNVINSDKVLEHSVRIVCAIIQSQGEGFKIQGNNLENMLKTAALSISNVQNMMFGTNVAAVDIESSVTDEYITCLEDGKKVKLLRKYLKRFGINAQDYIRKWNLPSDYKFVAPSYSRRRRDLAHKTQLGYIRQINKGKKDNVITKKAA